MGDSPFLQLLPLTAQRGSPVGHCHPIPLRKKAVVSSVCRGLDQVARELPKEVNVDNGLHYQIIALELHIIHEEKSEDLYICASASEM
jgi:hypothetical protein